MNHTTLLSRPAIDDGGDGDGRYGRLVGDAWRQLPIAVRRRFDSKLMPGEVKVYRGKVTCTHLSWAGWLLAEAARLVGAPLPLGHGTTGASLVAVTEEPGFCGQIWSRSYARPGRFPQVIHSAKRFTGPTGLEEYLGCGLLMRLTVSVEHETLVFRSRGFAVEIAGRSVPLPRWLSPGACEVRHRDDGNGRFTFTLTLAHPLLGRLVHQEARYCDEPQSQSL